MICKCGKEMERLAEQIVGITPTFGIYRCTCNMVGIMNIYGKMDWFPPDNEPVQDAMKELRDIIINMKVEGFPSVCYVEKVLSEIDKRIGETEKMD